MKTNHSSFFKATRASTLHTLALGCAFFVVSEARGGGYEECNQILTQDIFNRVIKGDSSSSAFRAEASEEFFEKSDTEAFEVYKKAFQEAKKKGTKIDAEFHYGVIGGELGIALNSETMLSQEDFSEKFNKEARTRKDTKSSKTSSSQDLVSNYASHVRDPGTVNAWKDCVTRTRETNLYAFASRDRAGKTYVNVMWVPGALAGSMPSIPISFVTGNEEEEEDIKIHAKPEEHVATGSGRHFAVSCGRKCDEGFQVTVNGTVKNAAGIATSDFTTTVEVPPLKPPAPPECPWEGDWHTEWTAGGDTKYSGIVTFTKKGEGLSGSYPNGSLELKGKGKAVAGRWFHTAGNSGGECQDGLVKYEKTECSFEGLWSYCSEAPKFWWKGTKLQ